MLTAHRAWLVTGANMGGKSTFLRQNAHVVILAQMGSFVPATAARVGLVDRLFCRVGSADDLALAKSTFMVEMEETARILQGATTRSLVLMDEVGRGTAVEEGRALAWAILEALCARRTRTLFATHFHQLQGVANQQPLGLYRMQTVLTAAGVVFAHRVEPGVATSSHGLAVARLAGCPESVVARAEALLASAEMNPVAGVE